jgi:predicted peroxiredoxin
MPGWCLIKLNRVQITGVTSMIKNMYAFLVVVLLLASNTAYSADAGQKLFVNLSSDDINRAAMAIGFSTKVRQQKKIPVTIFLNVEGVRIADKNIPGHKHANGKSLKEMLGIFIKAGGQVVICPMCMKHVGGLKKEDLVDGVKIGGPDVTWPALFAEGTTVLSY